LANLLAVTDAGLTGMDIDELLSEVLERLRGILDADTAAVLLHEVGTNELVARAARGLEEEVRQGVRVPIGVGFAGRIAANRQPVRLHRVDETTVANPILWEKGIQRMLGVPLTLDARLLGVLHVGRLSPRDFTLEDEELLQVAAERVAATIRTRQYAVEAAAAGMLERSLLPVRLPDVPGLQLAARYVPAENRAIGGDWYDAFVLPDGALWVITGDVAGHGLHAAVVMGRVKSALRAYALLGDGPAHVLELTDRKVEHFEIGTMVTIVCARAYPPFADWTICSAGHLPPVAAAPAVPTTLAGVRPGPPLGTVGSALREEAHLELPPGGLLLLYTDGLVERRDEAIDAGLERLRDAVRAAHPEVVSREVMQHLVGSDTPLDDIALLVLRRDPAVAGNVPPAASTAQLRVREFAADSDSTRAARRFALEAAGPLPPAAHDTLELLVSELATNAVIHGGTPFRLAVARHTSTVIVEVSDTGTGEVSVHDPAASDPHGRGLRIVARLAQSWGVHNNGPSLGKTVWFRLDIGSDARSPRRLP
jgi:serine phosphatase RsbU (regulator of sigma subunit)/anti-sigma regulatory factor (Ser/Thr protein kinase)